MPLEALLSHITSLIDMTSEYETETDQIPYAKIRLITKRVINCHRNGLKIIRDGLELSLIKKAELYSELKPKSGRILSTEQVIYTIYQEIVAGSYGTAERLGTDARMIAKTELAPELYLWLLDIPESFGIEKPLILHEGPRFLTETFQKRIVSPLQALMTLAENPTVPGSLAQVKPINLLGANPIEEGYVISCIRGEARNPIMWPILCHEMFELVDIDKGILKIFEKFVSKKEKTLPSLDLKPSTNAHWIREILMDFLAMNSFGPMYARSLLEYCKRSPYYQTPEYPEMCSRLFCSALSLSRSLESETDIYDKCRAKAKQDVEPEVLTYELNGDLDSKKKDNLTSLFCLMEGFLEEFKTPSFADRLKQYKLCSASSGATLEKATQGEKINVPFEDPLMTFDDIRNNILNHHVSLAIDPNILLNVILANYDLYQEVDLYYILLESIKKWKVKKAWNKSVDIFNKAAGL